MSNPPDRWEIEADAAFARGVDAGLRAWHGEWTPGEVQSLMARNERLKEEVRLARREARAATPSPTSPAPAP